MRGYPPFVSALLLSVIDLGFFFWIFSILFHLSSFEEAQQYFKVFSKPNTGHLLWVIPLGTLDAPFMPGYL